MKNTLLVLAATLLSAAEPSGGDRAYEESVTQQSFPVARLPVERQSPALAGATDWLNSSPLTAADLRGKVVLVDFWTYSCINWLRTVP